MPAYEVIRRQTIAAPAEKVIQTLADFRTWQTWSPWMRVDPNTKLEISDSPDAVGSTYRWEGEVCGSGQLTHLEIEPTRTWSRLEFFKPMKSHCETGFDAVPKTVAGCDEACELTWTMRGKLPFYLFFFKRMIETFVGLDYERGLLMIRDYCETGEVHSDIEVLGVRDEMDRSLVGIRGGASMDDIGEKMEATFADVDRSLTTKPGEAASLYHTTSNLKRRWFDYTSGYIDDDHTVAASDADDGGLIRDSMPGGRFFVVRHTGSMDLLSNAWMGGVQLIRHRKLKMAKRPGYEIYVSGVHADDDESEAVTDVYLAIK